MPDGLEFGPAVVNSEAWLVAGRGGAIPRRIAMRPCGFQGQRPEDLVARFLQGQSQVILAFTLLQADDRRLDRKQ